MSEPLVVRNASDFSVVLHLSSGRSVEIPPLCAVKLSSNEKINEVYIPSKDETLKDVRSLVEVYKFNFATSGLQPLIE